MGNGKLLLSANEAAAALSICPRTLWTLTNSGEVQSVKVRGRVLYAVEDLQQYVSRLRDVNGKDH